MPCRRGDDNRSILPTPIIQLDPPHLNYLEALIWRRAKMAFSLGKCSFKSGTGIISFWCKIRYYYRHRRTTLGCASLALFSAWTRRGHGPVTHCCLPFQFSWLSNWWLGKDLAKWCLKQVGTTKKHNTGLSWHFVWSFSELFAFRLYCGIVFILLQTDNNNTNWGWFPCAIAKISYFDKSWTIDHIRIPIIGLELACNGG